MYLKKHNQFALALWVICLFALPQLSQAQNAWQSIPAQAYQPGNNQVTPDHFALFQLDAAAIQQQMQAPSKILRLPLPDGRMESFRLREVPVLAPELAAKFPLIKTYAAEGIDQPAAQARIEWTYSGFHAYLAHPRGEIEIEPSGNNGQYWSYFVADIPESAIDASALSCGAEPATELRQPTQRAKIQNRGDEPLEVMTYRLALACTGEYAQQKGGTVELVLSSMVNAVNAVNAIFERETAVRMQLIADNDKIIFLDPNTDPYINADNGGGLLGQNTPAITQTGGIPFTNFDIGHVFTSGCSDVGGVVGGIICTEGKARGVTCHSSNNINAIVRRIMSHELAHQFTASHTWNKCPQVNPGQRASSYAYEPGSGSTIMSYAGSCGNQNIQFDNDAYYHVGSLEQFIGYSREGNGRTCATPETTDNHIPSITLPYANGFSIPLNTPFQLTATGTDIDGDNLTYCWEQYDLGPEADVGSPVLNGPSFRSFPPEVSSTRVFPRLTQILANQTPADETLPTYKRTLTFRCTVRDNHPGATGVEWAEMNFLATDQAGPFLVTYPNVDTIRWRAGEFREITWAVANTDKAPVNCQKVNILLSVDGGLNFNYTLASGVANTGAASITVPNITANAARVKIEAADNIFFDISNQNFRITNPNQPGYTLEVNPQFVQQVCLPVSDLQFNFTAGAILGYDEQIQLSIAEGLPEGAFAQFSSDSLRPGQSTTLSLDLTDVKVSGTFDIVIQAAAAGVDTAYRIVRINTVSNDFSALEIANPSDGASGVPTSPRFRWIQSPNATAYDLEIATSPLFGQDVVASATGIKLDTFVLKAPLELERNAVYYWRVRPSNSCGAGTYLPASSFKTVNVSCTEYSSEAGSINLPNSAQAPAVESTIKIATDGQISDINLPAVEGTFSPVRSLRFSLVSPAGTEVVLFNQNCAFTRNFSLGFDDDAATAIVCPPDKKIIHQPVEQLAKFKGENSRGDWKLRIKTVVTGDGAGGKLDAWKLEFCGDINPLNPVLVLNDTLYLNPGSTAGISSAQLRVEDPDNTPAEVTFTLVSVPGRGELLFDGSAVLKPGDTFTQADIDSGRLSYRHQGEDNELDGFRFVLTDNSGGYVGTPRFNIHVSRALDVEEPAFARTLRYYPNPAQQLTTIETGASAGQALELTLLSLDGQLLFRRDWQQAPERYELQAGAYPAGLYLLVFKAGAGQVVRKLAIQR